MGISDLNLIKLESMENSICMTRTFHPVGHGAFYTERFYIGDGVPEFTVVYDCGCFEAAKPGYSSRYFENWIAQIVDEEFTEDTIIDALFVSHFHADHANGINHLMKRCKVKRIFIPKLSLSIVVEAYLYQKIMMDASTLWLLDEIIESKGRFVGDANVIQFESSSERGDFGSKKEIDDIEFLSDSATLCNGVLTVKKIWDYMPYYCNSKDDSTLLSELRAELFSHGLRLTRDLYEDSKVIKDFVETLGVEECKRIYEKVYGSKHNAYSMTLLSKPASCQPKCKRHCLKFGQNPSLCYTTCLYMGDYDAKNTDNMTVLKSYYTQYKAWNQVGLIQVPHHGSENNYNDELYESPKLCIISSGKSDVYNHPDTSTRSSSFNQLDKIFLHKGLWKALNINY